MVMTHQYKIDAQLRQTCSITGLSPMRLLARAGLASDNLDNEDQGVDARDYFRLWEALALESEDPDLPLTLGRGASRGPFHPALLAFSSSPDIATGLARLSAFKPLVAPINLEVTKSDEHLSLRFSSYDQFAIPPLMAATEVIFFLDFARALTAHRVLPVAITLPDLEWVTQAYLDYIGGPVLQGDDHGIIFSLEDAERPLISVDTKIYTLIERELLARLSQQEETKALRGRVRRILGESLPSGEVSADYVSRRLNLSKRTLQRKLKEEGTNFQALLDQTRAELAMTYLRDQKLSAKEISYLLAYRDPNSFYRAFQDWTGMTPAEARASRAP